MFRTQMLGTTAIEGNFQGGIWCYNLFTITLLGDLHWNTDRTLASAIAQDDFCVDKPSSYFALVRAYGFSQTLLKDP